jgi:hypothetical protein
MTRKNNSKIKTQVGILVAKGLTTKQIAEKLNLTINQAKHLKCYYFNVDKKPQQSPQEKAWGTRRENQKVKQIEEFKPRLINLNGLDIEIHNTMIKRVIITDKNIIKII